MLNWLRLSAFTALRGGTISWPPKNLISTMPFSFSLTGFMKLVLKLISSRLLWVSEPTAVSLSAIAEAVPAAAVTAAAAASAVSV